MIARVLIYLLAVSVIYSSSGSTSSRFIRYAGNQTECKELDKPGWSIDDLQNVTLDVWPWHCLELRFNSSSSDLISNYSSDIFESASRGLIGFVQYYVERNHVTLSQSKDGQTLLHLAVQNGRLNVVKYIAARSTLSDLNAPNYEHKTPLQYAAFFGQHDIAKYLLSEAQVDLSYDEDDKDKVVRAAAEGGNLTIIKYLVDNRSYAIRREDQSLLLSAASGGNVNLIKYLIFNKNLTRIGTNKKGDNALHMAASKGRLEAVKFFIITLRYKVNFGNSEDATPAHLAVEKGSLIVLRYLIERQGALLNKRNGYGDFFIHIAAHWGHLAILKYLVDIMGMSVELKDYMQRTALHRAVRNDRLDVVRYLASEKHADLDSKDKDGRNLLYQAVLSGSIDMVKYLVGDLSMGVKINEADPNSHRTATSEAAYYGHLTILKFLMDHKNTKIWVVDCEGKNLLHIAAREGHLQMVKYLIDEKHFNVNSESPARLNAYDFAVMFEGDKKELLEYLYKRMYPELE